MRKIHRVVGIILLLPFFGWAITGLVFFIKPGYTGAYEILTPKTYPLDGATPVTAAPDWKEIRYVRTCLGDHLLVRTETGWQHLDPTTRQPRNKPTEAELRSLLKDAFSANPQRYGEITIISADKVQTNTGVEVSLDWNRLALQQKGKDTDWIDFLYRIHYLQWTGIKSVDKVVGLVGLVLVMFLAALGALIAIKRT